MKAEYLKIWESKLISSRKLNVYQSFKTNYNEQPYLMAIHNVEQRMQCTKFRISNHNLAIEEGRYSKENRYQLKIDCVLFAIIQKLKQKSICYLNAHIMLRYDLSFLED